MINIPIVKPASVEFQLRDGAYTLIRNADHLSICKPSSRDVETYTLLRDFVDQVRRRQVRTSTYIEPGYTNDIYLSIYLYIYLHCLSLLLHLPYTLVTWSVLMVIILYANLYRQSTSTMISLLTSFASWMGTCMMRFSLHWGSLITSEIDPIYSYRIHACLWRKIYIYNLHRVHDLPPRKIVLITSHFTLQSCNKSCYLIHSITLYLPLYMFSTLKCTHLNSSIYNAKL